MLCCSCCGIILLCIGDEATRHSGGWSSMLWGMPLIELPETSEMSALILYHSPKSAIATCYAETYGMARFVLYGVCSTLGKYAI